MYPLYSSHWDCIAGILSTQLPPESVVMPMQPLWRWNLWQWQTSFPSLVMPVLTIKLLVEVFYRVTWHEVGAHIGDFIAMSLDISHFCPCLRSFNQIGAHLAAIPRVSANYLVQFCRNIAHLDGGPGQLFADPEIRHATAFPFLCKGSFLFFMTHLSTCLLYTSRCV